MSFGQNLQFLRKLHRGMTQDELAEKMGVSRQTVSKWEMDVCFPEMEKALLLCELFSCSLDGLLRENMRFDSEAYTDLRIAELPAFRFVRYAVVSAAPEEDALGRLRAWATSCGIEAPQLIGWDFPFVSQEQVNVYHMHGYTAACVLPEGFDGDCRPLEVLFQPAQRYGILTVKEPFQAPFTLVPNAYQALARYLEVNGLRPRQPPEVLPCFERVYERGGGTYLDVAIAAGP